MTELYAHKIKLQKLYAYKTKYFSSTKKFDKRGFSVSHPGDRNQPLNPNNLQKIKDSIKLKQNRSLIFVNLQLGRK